MAAPQTVLELIERFDRNRIAYRSEQYNEARLRIEFLNPLFEALGWDVNNKQGYAEAYKDLYVCTFGKGSSGKEHHVVSRRRILTLETTEVSDASSHSMSG